MKKLSVRRMLILMIVVALATTTVFATDDWVYRGGGSHEAFWGYNATVAQVAGSIADAAFEAGLDEGSFNAVTATAVIGGATLRVLAETTTGCVFEYSVYTLQPLFQPIHYKYEITLVDSNGDRYGPFLLMPNPYSSNHVEKDIEMK